MANRLAALVLLLAALAGPARAEWNDAERKFVIQTLNQLQKLSFKHHREYCGFLGVTAHGKFATGGLSQGTLDSCFPTKPDYLTVTASFHTHGGFDSTHWSEVPSLQDVDSDAAGGTNGWVATPGGRLWFINGTTRTLTLVCGPGCMISDPNYVPNVPGPVGSAYTYDELQRLFRD